MENTKEVSNISELAEKEFPGMVNYFKEKFGERVMIKQDEDYKNSRQSVFNIAVDGVYKGCLTVNYGVGCTTSARSKSMNISADCSPVDTERPHFWLHMPLY